MKVLLENVGVVFTGDLGRPTLETERIVIDDGRVLSFDPASDGHPDLRIDCKGMTVAPGLVDTHIHPTIGDYAPKVQAVGYLEGMVHGGVTRAMSAGEVHIPGRDGAESALAFALAAYYSYKRYRPLGMKVHGGAMLFELDTEFSHIDRAFEAGIRIIGEIGIGALKDPIRAGELSAYARELGMTVLMHCGVCGRVGPNEEPSHLHFSAHDVGIVKPTVASHANTFASLSDEDIDLLCADGPPYVEIVQAGGMRPLLRIVEGLKENGCLDRLLIGTDTPTGYGVVSLGIMKTIGDVCSLAGVAPEIAWALASGHAAQAFGIDGNKIEEGAAADIVVMDAALGSVQPAAPEALSTGEWPGVALVMCDGQVRVNGSQATTRSRRVPEIEAIG